MHQYTVNASLQVLPVATDKHPYEWVDEAIAIIKQSGIKCEVGPFTTVVEGTYEQVMNAIKDINEYLYEKKCNEWILGVQLQIRSEGDITGEEKTAKHK
jgi:uncharacterized protein YqgV (UPF0045/DUF77 family)